MQLFLLQFATEQRQGSTGGNRTWCPVPYGPHLLGDAVFIGQKRARTLTPKAAAICKGPVLLVTIRSDFDKTAASSLRLSFPVKSITSPANLRATIPVRSLSVSTPVRIILAERDLTGIVARRLAGEVI